MSGDRSAPEKQPDGMEVSRSEILVYSSGSLANTMAGSIYFLITPIMVLTLGLNPVLAGLIMAIKTLWDAFTDPLMATISDNSSMRWGRRRPFMFGGGLVLSALCVMLWFFLPGQERAKLNTPEVASEEAQVTEVVASVKEMAGADELTRAEEAAILDVGLVPEEVSAVEPAQEVEEPKPAPAKKGMWHAFAAGVHALGQVAPEDRLLFWYLTIAMMMVATAHTVFSVPYYALGIELSPSYHGRTRVVAYRSIFEKVMGLVSPWFLPFCMMAVFPHAVNGAAWLTVILVALSVPAIIASSVMTKERTQVKKDRKKVALIPSIVQTLRNRHFLKIAALYIILQLALGLFLQFGLYINIFHVFGGDKVTAMQFGALMQAKVSTLGSILALASVPLITWVCKKFQKHNALRLALGLMAAGCFLNWFCYTPDNPNLQYILPFFFSLGISSTYTVLGTLMADVTDIDELNTGSRREGMFGAVMAWMSKGVGSIQALMAGALLVATGFNAEALSQTPETILSMRIMFSFAPTAVLLGAIALLYRYPLTRERMQEIKDELAVRREQTELAERAEAQ